MSNDPTPSSTSYPGPVVPVPSFSVYVDQTPSSSSTTPSATSSATSSTTSSATITPAPFPPDVPGALYRDAMNTFCRAWVGQDVVGYALVSPTSGWPFTLQVYTATTEEFLSKWTAQSGT